MGAFYHCVSTAISVELLRQKVVNAECTQEMTIIENSKRRLVLSAIVALHYMCIAEILYRRITKNDTLNIPKRS